MRLLQSSLGLGLSVLALSLVPMFVFPSAAALVALLALCGFAILDPLLVIRRRSWWQGALLSVLVWLGLLTVEVGVADHLQHLRESTMVFLLPFMIYPVVLAVSGLARLIGENLGWTPSKTSWIAGAISVLGIGALLSLQLARMLVPALSEKLTGETPPNTIYAGQDSKVIAAIEGQVDVLERGKQETYRLTSETKFDFRGPGSGKWDTPAGASWLKPEQRVNIDYVYRQGKRQAQLVCIWLDGSPCLPNPPAGGGKPAVTSLAGSVWEVAGRRPGEATRLEFREGGALVTTELYEGHLNTAVGTSTGHWKEDLAHGTVFVEVHDCFARYDGVLDGDAMSGDFNNDLHMHESWSARRTSAAR